jgi:hypothetical protein
MINRPFDYTFYSHATCGLGNVLLEVGTGASERSIMKQTGHRSEKMVRRYIKDGSLFRENAVAVVGL